MDERTLTALKASIRHWEENTNARRVAYAKISADDCALCGLFNKAEFNDYRCIGCPVSAQTQAGLCGKSPYHNAADCYRLWSMVGGNKRQQGIDFRAAAQAELDFLRSLLPETARAAVPTDGGGER